MTNSLIMTHLHVHTPEGSPLDGFCRIDDMIELAKSYDMPYVGVSDHGTCLAHPKFYKKALAAGIKPILGMEAYVAPNRFMKKKDYDQDPDFWDIHEKMNHLLLIAKNNKGYENLLYLSSMGNIEGFYKKPRIDFELMQKYGEGIICTTACLGSPVSQYILKGNDEMAKGMIRFYEQCFEELYLEIQPSDMEEQLIVNEKLKSFSEEMSIPLMVSTDAHMLRPEEKPIHAALTAIGKSEDENDVSVYEHCYFMSTEEVLSFGIPEEAIRNTTKIAESCDVKIDLDTIKFPVFDIPEGSTFDSYLTQLAGREFFQFVLDNEDIDFNVYHERLNYELDVVRKKQLSAYFLIVHDYIDFARKSDILVGPGRGEYCHLIE